MARIKQHGAVVDILSDGSILIRPAPGKEVVIDGDLNVTGEGGGSITNDAPVETPNGVLKTFTFSAPPKLVFRNGVMENRLGSVVGNTFVFVIAPETGDDIEGVV